MRIDNPLALYSACLQSEGMSLYQGHSKFLALLAHVFWPDAGLGFAHVGLVQKNHAKTTLTDTSTYAERQAAFQ
jgi:hypothetical protein